MGLYKTLKRYIQPALYKRQILLSRGAGREQVKAFVGLFSPIRTEHELVRIGGEGDGGYLVPDDLDQITACYSPGVSDIADFELDLAERGINCYLADYSVENAPTDHPNFDFRRNYVGGYDDDVFLTLGRWYNETGQPQGDLILQMDIEGAEYHTLLATPTDLLQKFRIIVLELHHLDRICDRDLGPVIHATVAKLLRDFDLVHIHQNNCAKPISYMGFKIPPVIEITLLRKDRIKERAGVAVIPHPLDRVCVRDAPDFPLPAEFTATR